MKYFSLVLLILISPLLDAKVKYATTYISDKVCEINSEIPRTMLHHQTFVRIGEQFLKCIGENKSVVISFTNHNMKHMLIRDRLLHRDIALVTWDRKAPTQEDREAMNIGNRSILDGISYHNSNIASSLMRCIEPNGGDNEFYEMMVVGHEILHIFIGSFHK